MKYLFVLFLGLMASNSFAIVQESSGIIYYPDATYSNQASLSGKTIKMYNDMVVARGIPATIKLTHAGSGTSTIYNFTSTFSGSTLVTLMIEPGAIIKFSSGSTIAGNITCNNKQQIFASETSQVYLPNQKTIYADWFGIDYSGRIDNSTALNTAIIAGTYNYGYYGYDTSTKTIIKFAGMGKVGISSTITLKTSTDIDGSKVKFVPLANVDMFYIAGYSQFHDADIDCSGTTLFASGAFDYTANVINFIADSTSIGDKCYIYNLNINNMRTDLPTGVTPQTTYACSGRTGTAIKHTGTNRIFIDAYNITISAFEYGIKVQPAAGTYINGNKFDVIISNCVYPIDEDTSLSGQIGGNIYTGEIQPTQIVNCASKPTVQLRFNSAKTDLYLWDVMPNVDIGYIKIYGNYGDYKFVITPDPLLNSGDRIYDYGNYNTITVPNQNISVNHITTSENNLPWEFGSLSYGGLNEYKYEFNGRLDERVWFASTTLSGITGIEINKTNSGYVRTLPANYLYTGASVGSKCYFTTHNNALPFYSGSTLEAFFEFNPAYVLSGCTYQVGMTNLGTIGSDANWMLLTYDSGVSSELFWSIAVNGVETRIGTGLSAPEAADTKLKITITPYGVNGIVLNDSSNSFSIGWSLAMGLEGLGFNYHTGILSTTYSSLTPSSSVFLRPYFGLQTQNTTQYQLYCNFVYIRSQRVNYPN